MYLSTCTCEPAYRTFIATTVLKTLQLPKRRRVRCSQLRRQDIVLGLQTACSEIISVPIDRSSLLLHRVELLFSTDRLVLNGPEPIPSDVHFRTH